MLSPSSGLPGALPLPYELGQSRLQDDFGLKPVEYPSTRKVGSTPEERAADIHAAFADPDIKAVIASIGGDDQIAVLPHLDRTLLRANPKPFFGYSDSTNLLLFLRNLGIVGYHGGTMMVELGRPGAMRPKREQCKVGLAASMLRFLARHAPASAAALRSRAHAWAPRRNWPLPLAFTSFEVHRYQRTATAASRSSPGSKRAGKKDFRIPVTSW